MTLVDKYTKEELQKMANECTNMHQFVRKIGYKSDCTYNTVRKKCSELGVSLEHFTGRASNEVKRTEDNVFIKNSTASQTTLRRWYLKGNYSPYQCSICGQEPFWNGKELTLTLDHINGDNHDDRLENLRWVCPNCDRQLDTFCAKNSNRQTYYTYKEKSQNYCIDCGKPISSLATRCVDCYAKYAQIVERPSAETLRNLLEQAKGCFTEVGRQFKVSDNAIRKWCKQYGLPTHTKDYK